MSKSLYAISPIDGRYFSKVEELSIYFSEFALIKYRVRVEIEYLIALSEGPLSKELANVNNKKNELKSIYKKFDLDDAKVVKEHEKKINHDVKAVEYFIKQKLEELNLIKSKEYVHFGLTSQDINNTSIPLSLKEALEEVIIPKLEGLNEELKRISKGWAGITMLARTHGQAASPTNLGKEVAVFVERLNNQINQLKTIEHRAKFGGATGNFNAHHIAFPHVSWPEFGDSFVGKNLGLKRSQFTTQIEHYDQLAAIFDNLSRINTILIDLDRDFWQYISMGYFKQKIKKGEVGSSAMPHKVNPIDFENSEGNLGIANAIFQHLSMKLPISRLQRDLTDSTVLRNVGVPLAHSLLAYKSLLQGLSKIEVNQEVISEDLKQNWAVVAEAIQTVLRREEYPNPYEKLKDLTRGNEKLDEQRIKEFIRSLDVTEDLKSELLKITPENYSGTFPKL